MSNPAPLEWHPAYRDRAWLLDWLNDVGAYAGLDRVVLAPRRMLRYTTEIAPQNTVTDKMIILNRRLSLAFAPYVGAPFVYGWMVGTDQYGRAIAGESRIIYI